MTLSGYVRNLNSVKKFAFIVCEETRQDYFFHKDDFAGHWHDLESDYVTKRPDEKIRVEFEATNSEKGPRAKLVRRIDFPNEG